MDKTLETRYENDSKAIEDEYKTSETSFQTQSTVTLHKIEKSDLDQNYDPLQNRNLPHPTSTIGSFFHLLKSSLGSGLLSMPYAFMKSGIVIGCIGTIVVAVIATHCIHILVRTSRDLCKEMRVPSLSYTDTCEEAVKRGPVALRPFSHHVRRFVDTAMAGVCIGGTSVYVLFVASALKDIFDHNLPEHTYSVEAYCGFLLLPLIITTQIRYLKFLVPFSIFANICLVFTFGITCYYCFRDVGNVSERRLVSNVAGWPLFVSTAIFAMEGINVVMPIENEMKNPRYFLGVTGILNCTMVFVALLYGVVGLFGYLKYGDEVLGSITYNLPQDQPIALTAKILVALAVFFTYCLQMYAPMDIIWTRMSGKVNKKYHNIAQVILRTTSVTLTVIMAVAIPDLQLLIGLVGAIFFSTLGLFIPAAIEIIHKWNRDLGAFKIILWKNMVLLFCYAIVLCSGCYTAISEIVAKYASK